METIAEAFERARARVLTLWHAIGWQLPGLAIASVALVVIAVLLTLSAIFAEPLGLGLTEAFYLFLAFGWSRTTTVLLMAGLVVVACVLFVIAYVGMPDKESSRWVAFRTILGNSGLVLASILVGLVILEAAVRVMDGVDFWPLRNITAERNALLRTQTANVYHPDVGWVLAPNMPGKPDEPEGVSLTTGAHGVRMNDFEIKPLPKGGILASGDSFTAGSEVGNKYTWPAQLEQLLGRPVVNGGVGGWATDQIVRRVYDLLPVVEPKTVVVSFFQDDILRSGYRTYAGSNKPWFTVENGELVRHYDPVPLFTGKAEEVGGLSVLGYSYLVTFVSERIDLGTHWARSQTSYVAADNDPVAVSCKLLEKLQADLDAANVRLLFVMQFGGRAAIDIVERQPHAVEVIECADAAGIETLDMWQPQKDIGLRDMDAYRGLFVMHDENRIFGHMSNAGNKLVAEHIAERLKVTPALNAQQP